MKKKISNKDREDWNNFIKSKDKMPDKDQQVLEKKSLYYKKTIDLHGYNLDSANTEIEKFISSCFNQGVIKINIITGKGTRSKNKHDPYQSKDLSILKFSIPNYIKENKQLMKKILKIDFEAVEDPNKGSFNVTLRKKND